MGAYNFLKLPLLTTVMAWVKLMRVDTAELFMQQAVK